MDPLTLAIMGIGTVSQMAGGATATRQANRNLANQMRMHDQNMRLAKGRRTDAYGNATYFDDATGQWVTELTPMQKALIRAGEYEQLQGLTEDASRNRRARRRQEVIGRNSAEDYNRLLAEFRYSPVKSEDMIFDEISRLLASSRDIPDPGAGRQALRQGRPIVTQNQTRQRNSMAERQLLARKAAMEEFNARSNAKNQRLLPALEFMRQGVGQGGGAGFNFSDTPGRLDQTQDSMSKLIASVGTSGADNLLRAGEGLTKARQSQYPTMTDFARMYAATTGKSRGGVPRSNTAASSTQYDGRTLDDLLYGDG